MTVRLDGRLAGVAPLYLHDELRLGTSTTILRFWENPYSNRIAPLVLEAEASAAMDRLVQCIACHHLMTWDIGELGTLRLGADSTALLELRLRDAGLWTTRLGGYSSPYRELPSDWEGMTPSLSRSFRKTLNRRVNQARRAALSCKIHSDRSALEDVLSISEKTWQHVEGTGLTSSQSVRSFYERIVDEAEAAGQLEIGLLHANDHPIAFELNLASRGTTYNLKVGYDPQFASLSPGLVLMHHTIREAIHRGQSAFDFLGEAEPYKLHWTNTTRDHGSLFVVRRGFRWKLYFLLRYRLKALLERSAPWLLQLKRALQVRLRGS